MNLPPISKDHWRRWVDDPVTQTFLNGLYQTREELKEGLAESQASTEKDLYIIVGRCQALRDALDVALKNFPIVEEENDSN